MESRTVQGKEESSRGWEASSRERVVAGFFLAMRFSFFSFSLPLFFFFYNLLSPARPLNIVATAIHVALLAARAIRLAAAKVPTFSPAGE